jgi:MFS family permease
MVPITGAIGYACANLHIYGFGPYFEPVGAELGWSRTQVALGISISAALSALLSVPLGMMVDRFGPRRIALAGVPLTGLAVASLGQVTGTAANWIVHWLLISVAILGVQATVWASAVASRFTASRGFALAVMLCGSALASAIFPSMATELIAQKGWREAIVWQSAIWTAIAFPMVAVFFRGARDDRAGDSPIRQKDTASIGMREALRSTIYLRLLLASLFFSVVVISLAVHFVPILSSEGFDRSTAAKLAGMMGIASAVGRLGAGLLIDRFRASLVGAVIFMLPMLGCVLLLASNDGAAAMLAAVLVGLGLGAEVDVILYLVVRFFGLGSFGALFGGVLTSLAIGTTLGPLAASAVFDRTGSYSFFLQLAVASMIIAAVLLVSLPRPALGQGKLVACL